MMPNSTARMVWYMCHSRGLEFGFITSWWMLLDSQQRFAVTNLKKGDSQQHPCTRLKKTTSNALEHVLKSNQPQYTLIVAQQEVPVNSFA